MSLTHPAFLWGLTTLAAPLWIHLSRKRKYQEMPLGSLRFLQDVLRERARLEEIPLMLQRLLALGLLALLFWPDSGKAEDQPAETIVLLDASGSILF